MSLNLTPSSGPRPLPRSRSKRASPSPSKIALPADLAGGSGSGSAVLRVERDEAALAGCNVVELINLVREGWEERDELLEQVQQMRDERDGKDVELRELMRALGTLQSRSDEAFNEQARLEADLEARNDVVDRVRARLSMAEREVREVQGRYHEQEKSIEAERAAFQAQEAHLQSRLRTLTMSLAKSSSGTRHSHAQPHSAVVVAEMEDELATLRISHTTLLAQLNTLSGEVHDLKLENVRLREENEGWEYLVRERTFSRHMIRTFSEGKGARNDSREGKQLPLQEGKSQLEVLDEELEAEMGELTTDLEAQTPTMGDESRRKRGNKRATTTVLSPGGHGEGRSVGKDLATELGLANETDEYGISDDRIAAENKELKEEIKALQLYCSKILDRIIAQDDFEHVLSVDYKTRRMGKSASSNRTSVREVIKTMQSPDDFGANTNANAVARLDVTAKEKEKETEGDKTDRRARRGFSLDFRSFGFGGTSAPSTPTTESKPALRALTLSGNASATKSPNISRPPRKLEPHAEDDEDRRERSRLEAALKLMGIDRPRSSSPLETATASPVVEVDIATAPKPAPALQRKVSASARGTPVSRLSSAFVFSPTPLPADPNPDESTVQAALDDLDAKDRHEAGLLAKGKAEVGYTSPPRLPPQMSKSESVSTLWSAGSGGGNSRPVSMDVGK